MKVGKLLLLVGALFLVAVEARAAPPAVRYHTIKVEGVDMFYREAGSQQSHVILLLHGRQTSSHMFRDLIPLLSVRYRVIAPDLPSFGQSGTPSTTEFAYTFDHLAFMVAEFLKQLGIERYSLMMQDFGVPIGFRVASGAPERVERLIIQNGVICDEQNRKAGWLEPFWANRDAATEKRLRKSYELKTTIKYYQIGASKLDAIAPDAWVLSQYYLDQPGRHDAQVELMHDFASNRTHFVDWQTYLRKYQPPTLVLWGKDSPIYSVEHAECYCQANPATIIRVFNGGHFLLEEYFAEAASEIFKLRYKTRGRKSAAGH